MCIMLQFEPYILKKKFGTIFENVSYFTQNYGIFYVFKMGFVASSQRMYRQNCGQELTTFEA